MPSGTFRQIGLKTPMSLATKGKAANVATLIALAIAAPLSSSFAASRPFNSPDAIALFSCWSFVLSDAAAMAYDNCSSGAVIRTEIKLSENSTSALSGEG